MNEYFVVVEPGRTSFDNLGVQELGVATDYRQQNPDSVPFAELGGRYWLAGDVRVDDRISTCARLGVAFTTGDALLILHSYARWGPGCLDHLIGDFSFCIWDRQQQSLFAGRDQMGVKPVYYVVTSNGLLVSNLINRLLGWPGVSRRLNDLAVADFLMFGFNQEPSTTTFADIQRLRRGHWLLWQNEQVRIQRYWSLPIEAPVRQRSPRDYVEGLRSVVSEAVRDRLPSGPLAIWMSGGLDSTYLAAEASRWKSDIQAYCVVHSKLFNDEEGHYAQLAARHIGIPLNLIQGDDFGLFEEGADATPEPVSNPFHGRSLNVARRMSQSGQRVAFEGEDPDSCLQSEEFLRQMSQASPWNLLADLLLCLRYRVRPPVGLRPWTSLSNKIEHFPPWMQPQFAQKWRLRERWQLDCDLGNVNIHPWRPKAYFRLAREALFSCFCEQYQASWLGVPIETRHPVLDLRVVSYLLRLPAWPWALLKTIWREMCRGRLPGPLLSRKKVGFQGDPAMDRLRTVSSLTLQHWLEPHSCLGNYVDPNVLHRGPYPEPDFIWPWLQALSLNIWMKQQE